MKKIVAFNWKENPDNLSRVGGIVRAVLRSVPKKRLTIVIIPPALFIEKVRKLIGIRKEEVFLGVQNVSHLEKGAFTGEFSAAMLGSLKVTHAIVGHSERRYLFGETDKIISLKIKSCLKNKIKPILCVGEKKKMPQEKSWSFIRRQLETDLPKIPDPKLRTLIVAYEPVWSIGGNRKVNPSHAAYMIDKIKSFLYSVYGRRYSVLYGGSVGCKNIKNFLKYHQIDGFLVGSASLRPAEIRCLLKLI